MENIDFTKLTEEEKLYIYKILKQGYVSGSDMVERIKNSWILRRRYKEEDVNNILENLQKTKEILIKLGVEKWN